MSPLKVERFLQLIEEEKVKDSKYHTDLPTRRWRGPCARRGEQPLGAKIGPQLTASEEPRTSVLQPQGNEFCQQQEEAWEQIFSPKPPAKNSTSPTTSLHHQPCAEKGTPNLTSDLQRWELINGCCFKPLVCGKVVTQQWKRNTVLLLTSFYRGNRGHGGYITRLLKSGSKQTTGRLCTQRVWLQH